MMHIPLVQAEDRGVLFEILADRPHTFSLSAHTHTQYHLFLDGEDGWKGEYPHHHLVHGTSCGGWWTGRPDEHGIPHATMGDGTPNGYSIIEFHGNRYTVTWKAARRPADHQMNVFAPDAVKTSETQGLEIIANIFAASELSEAAMRVDDQGPWISMERFPGKDPGLERMNRNLDALAVRLAAERGMEEADKLDRRARRRLVDEYRDLLGRPLVGPGDCRHLFRAALPEALTPGIHLIRVRERDLFGRLHEGRRVLRVIE